MALNFPSQAEVVNQNPANTFSPTSTPKSTDNGLTYIWNGNSWDLEAAAGAGGVGEAPSDNTVYGRKNASWSRISFEDGATYLRTDNAAGAQVVSSTSDVTFTGQTTHENGVSVTGGVLDTSTVIQNVACIKTHTDDELDPVLQTGVTPVNIYGNNKCS